MEPAQYLERIGFEKEVRHDVATLEGLQRAHLTTVPFENLHVFHRRGVRTDDAWSVPKVLAGRGGWCFELNGAFAALLEAIDFSVTRLAAAVLIDGAPATELDHHTIRVDFDTPYLVDVGFGDSFIRPLRLDTEEEQDGGTMPFRLRRDGDHYVLEGQSGDGWVPEFRFELIARESKDFLTRSQYLQTASELKWTQAPFATRLLDNGPDRVWLLHDRLKFRRDGEITETSVTEEAWPVLLEEWFDLEDRRTRDALPDEVVAVVDHQPPDRAPFEFPVGAAVTIADRESDWPAFVFARTAAGEGWVPARYLSAASGDAVVDTPYDTTELATNEGEWLTVVDRDDESGWLWCRNAAGREGWVPSRTVLPASAAESES